MHDFELLHRIYFWNCFIVTGELVERVVCCAENHLAQCSVRIKVWDSSFALKLTVVGSAVKFNRPSLLPFSEQSLFSPNNNIPNDVLTILFKNILKCAKYISLHSAKKNKKNKKFQFKCINKIPMYSRISRLI